MAVNKNIPLNHILPKQVGWNGYFESREEIATSTLLFLPYLISCGNCALVTRKLEMWWEWRRRMKVLISGYMIGSPTRESAQCLTAKPSSYLSGFTPGTPGVRKVLESAPPFDLINVSQR